MKWGRCMSERKEILSYKTTTKNEIFNNRRVVQCYCQADVTVLRELSDMDVFLERMTITISKEKMQFSERFGQNWMLEGLPQIPSPLY